MKLWAVSDGDAVGSGRDAVGQPHPPCAFAVVHLQNEVGVGWRVVKRFLDDEEVRTHLFNANGVAVEQQLHVDFGGVAAVTR